MVNRNSRKLRISIPIEDRQSRLHTFSKNIQTASNNHPAYRVSFEYIFLCVNEPWKSAERERDRERKKGDKNRAKQSARFEFASASLPNPRGIRLRCTLAYLSDKISPPPLPSPPSRFQRFPSRAREREREEGGGLSQLRAIWREFAADTALKLGRIFLLFLFFISKRRIIEGGRGEVEGNWKRNCGKLGN